MGSSVQPFATFFGSTVCIAMFAASVFNPCGMSNSVVAFFKVIKSCFAAYLVAGMLIGV